LEASADFRDLRNALSRLGTWTLLGFLPLQRPNPHDVTNRTPALPLPVPRFSQPFNRSYAALDLQVCSTLQALLGFGLQSLTLRRSSYVVRTRAPSSLPAFHDFLPLLADIPAYLHHRGLTVPAMQPNHGPFVSLRRQASILGFSRPWSFIPALKHHLSYPSFTRNTRQ
jgi:hypothetical protein